ncbi:MAG: hypothetical protein KDD19_05175 [Phaeodactylibacter sp.]|nr:hypothetical protein [Phaeodactylibacter sp.]MCB9053017.1 hypothetical protein [Lewinellaceae bacterium]
MKNNLLTFVLLLFSSFGVLEAQSYEIFVSDAGNFSSFFQVLRFDANGENGEVFTNEQLAWPQDIVILEHRNSVIVSNLNSGKITEYNIDSGEYLGDFATGISGPTRMKIGADGLLYVLQWQGNGRVLRYDLDGNFVDTFTDTNVTNSIGLDWDASGNLYVSSYNGRYVQQFNSSGESMGRFITSNLNGPTNIWFDDEGNLFVSDWNAGSVKKFDASGNYIGVFINGVGSVEGVDFLPDGSLLIGAGQNSSVNRYDSEGNFIEEFIPQGTLGLRLPNAVIIRALGISSLHEVPEQVNFIAPSVGTEFSVIGTNAAAGIESFEVYDVQGRMQVRIPYSGNTTFWNASAVAEGLYLIVARLKDGAAWSQKVVVKK